MKFIDLDETVVINPEASSWISASAGAGKTSMLVKRILSLMIHGYAPSSILCLTFTNVAAEEMRLRIATICEKWIGSSIDNLRQEIIDLIFRYPSEDEISCARNLFLKISEDGPKILTIHGFCFLLLKNLARHGDYSGYFDLITEHDSMLIIEDAVDAVSKSNFKLFSELFAGKNIKTIATQIKCFIDKNASLGIFEENIKDVCARLSVIFNMSNCLSDCNSVHEHFQFLENEIWTNLLSSPFGMDNKDIYPQAIKDWFYNDLEYKKNNIQILEKFFLTSKREIRKKIGKEFIDDQLFFYAFVLSIDNLQAYRKAIAFYEFSCAVGDLTKSTRRKFLKSSFSDLICDCLSELKNDNSVARGIVSSEYSHIMLDEAQDCNIPQWKIFEILATDIIFGDGVRSGSFFVVGDPKQCIYGFQGANPHFFNEVGERLIKIAYSINIPAFAMRSKLSYRLSHEPMMISNLLIEERISKILPNEKGDQKCYKNIPGSILCKKFAEDNLDNISNFIISYISNSLKSGRLFGDHMILFRRRCETMKRVIAIAESKGWAINSGDNTRLWESAFFIDFFRMIRFLVDKEDLLSEAVFASSPFRSRFKNQENDLFFNLSEEKISLSEVIREALFKLNVFDFCIFVLFELGFVEDLRSEIGVEAYEGADWLLREAERLGPVSALCILELESKSEEIFNHSKLGFDKVNSINILTIHASKGLQAPIVIVGDSGHISYPPESILVKDNIAIFCPNVPCAALSTVRKYTQLRAYEEDDRLFYVALTRTEDKIVFCGLTYEEKKKDNGSNWISFIENAFEIQENATSKS